MFKDRTDAGNQLAVKLEHWKNKDCVVFSIPRGGVPVAFSIANILHLPLEIVLVKKIGHPENKEYAIGATNLSDYFIKEDEKISNSYIEQELDYIRKRLKEMSIKYAVHQKHPEIKGKSIIIVDDGIATGKTIIQTIHLLKNKNPSEIIVAVPVCSKRAKNEILESADKVVTLIETNDFFAIGSFYENFDQVSDEEVAQYLKRAEECHHTI
ncbi:MAG: phosphoribosyltransferase [Ferruginibacter sp.]|nr:phosphoribosyltransferase [Ferruginibacter sp.]